MKMEKKYLLKKIFLEWGEREINQNGGEGEFKYKVFDIL
jgi:hypothetical protein